MMVYVEEWKWEVVLLSFAMSVVGALNAISLNEHRRGIVQTAVDRGLQPDKARVRNLLALVAFLIAANAIWAMHFVGMSAMSLKHPSGATIDIQFDIVITALSLLAVVVCMMGGFALAAADPFTTQLRAEKDSFISDLSTSGITTTNHMVIQRLLMKKLLTTKLRYLLCSAVLVGGGVSVMHFMGMLAMSFGGSIHWDAALVAVSVLIAVVVSFIGLFLMFRVLVFFPYHYLRIVSAFVIAAAVCGMHFTGMRAASYHVVDGTYVDSSSISWDVSQDVLSSITIILVLSVTAAYQMGTTGSMFLSSKQKDVKIEALKHAYGTLKRKAYRQEDKITGLTAQVQLIGCIRPAQSTAMMVAKARDCVELSPRECAALVERIPPMTRGRGISGESSAGISSVKHLVLPKNGSLASADTALVQGTASSLRAKKVALDPHRVPDVPTFTYLLQYPIFAELLKDFLHARHDIEHAAFLIDCMHYDRCLKKLAGTMRQQSRRGSVDATLPPSNNWSVDPTPAASNNPSTNPSPHVSRRGSKDALVGNLPNAPHVQNETSFSVVVKVTGVGFSDLPQTLEGVSRKLRERVYKTYIAADAPFAINISHKLRSSTNTKISNNSKHDNFSVFNAAISEVMALLIANLTEFFSSDVYKIAVLVVRSLDAQKRKRALERSLEVDDLVTMDDFLEQKTNVSRGSTTVAPQSIAEEYILPRKLSSPRDSPATSHARGSISTLLPSAKPNMESPA